MKKFLRTLFVLLMAVTVVLLVWSVPDSVSLRDKISESEKSIETARGRERKQQAELEKALQDVAAAQEKLAALQPELDAALAGSSEQKAERKRLKAEKQELEDRLAELLGEKEETADE